MLKPEGYPSLSSWYFHTKKYEERAAEGWSNAKALQRVGSLVLQNTVWTALFGDSHIISSKSLLKELSTENSKEEKPYLPNP